MFLSRLTRIRPPNCSNLLQHGLNPGRNVHSTQARPKAVKLTISHCAAWKDFQAKCRELVNELEKSFPGKLEVTVEPIKEKSDDFEVFVDQELVHSMRYGDGFADRPCKMKAIKEAIKKKL